MTKKKKRRKHALWEDVDTTVKRIVNANVHTHITYTYIYIYIYAICLPAQIRRA